MEDGQLREIEAFAVGITRKAGAILLERFQKPLEVEYKSEHLTNPVTEADKRSEEYLVEAILRDFPGDGILAEEGSQVDSQRSGLIWVIDPLDGTVNFLNGLPIFAVSVGVLDRGLPVVGCIFTPSTKDPAGSVFHARTGGGAFRDGVPIRVARIPQPQQGRVSIFPAYYARALHLKRGLRKRLGEVRSPGSVAYELAMTACGAIQYSIYGSPWVWDVAAGIPLITEARGIALVRRRKQRKWEPFRGFVNEDGSTLQLQKLKEWRAAWIFGNREITQFVTDHLGSRTRIGVLMRRWL